MKTIAFAETPACFVLLHAAVPPDDAEWKVYLEHLGRHFEERPRPRILVLSRGGAPTPKQRRDLDARFAKEYGRAKTAILSGSTFVRGVVNAFRLIHPNYKAFESNDLDGALAYLDALPGQAVEVRRAVVALEAELGAASYAGR